MSEPRVRWSEGGPFAVVPAWVLESEISDRAKLLYAHLARLAGSPEAKTFRGKTELGERLGCSKSSVEKATAELVEIGAVTVKAEFGEGGGRRPNSYIVHARPTSPLLRPDDPPPAGAGDPPPDGEGGGDSSSIEARASLGVEREVEQETSGAIAPSAAPHPPRERDLPFDAMAEATRSDPTLEGGRIAKAVNELRKHPDYVALREQEGKDKAEARLAAEIGLRARAYRRTFRAEVALTPQALVNNWRRVVDGGGDRPLSPEEIAPETFGEGGAGLEPGWMERLGDDE